MTGELTADKLRLWRNSGHCRPESGDGEQGELHSVSLKMVRMFTVCAVAHSRAEDFIFVLPPTAKA